MDAYEINRVRAVLEGLRIEHRDLDDIIEKTAHCTPIDMLQIQRLKKRKLALKDQIARLENRLIPDIIA